MLEHIGNVMVDSSQILTKFTFKNLGIGLLGPVPFYWNVSVWFVCLWEYSYLFIHDFLWISLWGTQITYTFGGGRVSYDMFTSKEVIEGPYNTLSIFVWLNICQGLLSLISIILSLRSLIENWNLYEAIHMFPRLAVWPFSRKQSGNTIFKWLCKLVL